MSIWLQRYKLFLFYPNYNYHFYDYHNLDNLVYSHHGIPHICHYQKRCRVVATQHLHLLKQCV